VSQADCVIYLAPDRVEFALSKLGQVMADTVIHAVVSPAANGTGNWMAEALAVLRAAWPLNTRPTPATARRVYVVISNRYVRWQLLPWNDALLDRKTSEAQYRSVFSAVWSNVLAGNVVYEADDAPYGMPRAVMSMEGAAVDDLKSLVNEHGDKLVSLRPMIAAAWDAVCDRISEKDYAFCTVEQDSLTLAVIRGGRMQAVTTQTWNEDWVDVLDLFWRRAMLRDASLSGIGKIYTLNMTEPVVAINFPKTSPIMLLDVQRIGATGNDATPVALNLAAALSLDAATHSTLDFIRQPLRYKGWRLGLLVTGVLLTGVAVWQGWQYHVNMEGVQHRIEQVNATVQPLVRTRSASEQRALDIKVRAINEAIGQLNLPITSLLRAIQPPRDVRVVLLGMDVAGRNMGVLKISAEARTGQEMATYVAYLSDKRIFDTVYLTKHEIAEHDPEQPFRFTLEATWRE